jgi:hypothetical protein
MACCASFSTDRGIQSCNGKYNEHTSNVAFVAFQIFHNYIIRLLNLFCGSTYNTYVDEKAPYPRSQNIQFDLGD